MNNPALRKSVWCPRVAQILFCSVVLSSVAVNAFAETAPQFAFGIGSNQIPGGIWPSAIGTDSGGKVYISSLWNVIKVDTNGSVLKQWGTQGTGPGQFSYAGQTAFDGSGHVYIADGYNDRVEEFDTNGNFIFEWGTNGSKAGQFDQVEGLAVSPSGRIYVSDSLNFRIQIFGAGGLFLKQFGTLGTNEGQFSFPGVIATDSSNYVYVVDSPGGSFDNYRVQKFDAQGNFIRQWGSPGINSNSTIGIGGIATDKDNNVYVADNANDRIQKFTSDGVFLSEWGSPGNGPGQFNGPMGIAIDPTGNYVYVGDYYNARVNVFAYAGLGPLLYQPPTNQAVPVGVNLTLNAGVFAAQPLAFQWFFGGTPVAGGTDASLVISNVPSSAAGAYSVSASNSLGAVSSQPATVTVLPVVVTTLPATGISATGAVLHGSVWVGSAASSAWFEWGTNSSYGQAAGFTNVGADSTVAVSTKLNGLSGEVIYHYRLVGSNSVGVAYGQDASFQIGLKPTIQTLPVSPIDSGSVFLNALVNPEARDTTVFFRWGKYNAYQNNTPTNQLPSLSTASMVQNPVAGLVPGVLYLYQPVASNALGTVTGSIASFVAPPWAVLPVPPGNVWSLLACSADATRLAAVGSERIYGSPDSGMTWVTNAVLALAWQSLAMSFDGSHLFAGSGSTVPGPAYVSTNFGKSWMKSNGPARNWRAVSSSGDGLLLSAVDPSAQLVLTSTDGGLNWHTNSPQVLATWSTIASSADGRRLIVGAGGVDRTTNGPVYTSSDSGASWVSNSLPVSSWRSVASSASGEILLAAAGGLSAGPVYVSTNAGASWSITSAPVTNWQSVAVSADGSVMAALARFDAAPLFISTDLGVTWQSYVLPQAMRSDVVISADGARLFVPGDQNIFTLQRRPTPNLKTGLSSQGVALSWVIPSVPFVLQQSADVSTGQWTDFSATPVANPTSLTYQVTIPSTGKLRFFRLKEAMPQN